MPQLKTNLIMLLAVISKLVLILQGLTGNVD